jgi:hypothetical protein
MPTRKAETSSERIRSGVSFPKLSLPSLRLPSRQSLWLRISVVDSCWRRSSAKKDRPTNSPFYELAMNDIDVRTRLLEYSAGDWYYVVICKAMNDQVFDF